MAELDLGMSDTKWRLLDDDYLMARFLGKIRSQYGWFDAIGMPALKDLPAMDLRGMFVEPLLAEKWVDPEAEPETWPAGANLLDTLARHPRILVQGDPGSGKTILSSWLAWHVASVLAPQLPEFLRERVPLPVALRDMRAEAFGAAVDIAALAQILARQLLADDWSEDKAARLAEWVARGRYILILDGIDEIAPWQRACVAAWLQQAERDDAYALATSRLVGYDDYPVHCPFVPCEIPGGGSYNQLQADAAWAQVNYLMPFDRLRVLQFIQKWYHLRSADHYEAVKHASALEEAIQGAETTRILARTPNLLGLMAVVFRERAYLPDGKALLYREIVNAYLNTIDRQRKIPVHDTLVGYGWEVREQWLAAVAFEMQLIRDAKWWANVGQRQAEETANSPIDRACLATETQVLTWLTSAMERNNVAQPETVAVTFLAWVGQRSGLLLPRGEGLYGFSHLSFQEYFCARFLKARYTSPAFIKGKLGPDAVVTPKKFQEWAIFRIWEECFVFLFELVSCEQDQEWVSDLLDITIHDIGRVPYGYSGLSMRLALNKHINLKKNETEMLLARCSCDLVLPWHWDANNAFTQALVTLGVLGYYDHFDEAEPLHVWLNQAVSPTKCRALFINHSTLKTLPSLTHLLGLVCLVVCMPELCDIKDIENNVALECLSMPFSKIGNVKYLKKMKKLRYLNIQNTLIDDVAPLLDLAELRDLVANNTPISNFSLLESKPELNIVR